jgi:hypothetical protein
MFNRVLPLYKSILKVKHTVTSPITSFPKKLSSVVPVQLRWVTKNSVFLVSYFCQLLGSENCIRLKTLLQNAYLCAGLRLLNLA